MGPGTYALLLRCAAPATVRVGRLGVVPLDPGFYVYVGSALGPGGVRARVTRHFRARKRRHWHIDYLHPAARPLSAWYSEAPERLEHDWAQRLGALPGVTAVNGFGCSDCRCSSHLFHAGTDPEALRQALGDGLGSFEP